MVRDLQLLKDITPLFKKKLIIWGIGKKGHEIIQDIISMGAGKRGIYLCDSDYKLTGNRIYENEILSPEDLQSKNLIFSEGGDEVAILVTPVSVKVQDEIIEKIESLFGKYIDIYTYYAVVWGIYFGLKSPYVNKTFKSKKLIEHEKNSFNNKNSILNQKKIFQYFTFLPLYNDEIILVYQPGKVASTSIYHSIQSYNRNVLHCHSLNDIESTEGDLCKILNIKSGKIICLVRDPIARTIAAMWQNVSEVEMYSAEVDFAEIENYFFPDGFWRYQFRWLDEEIKRYFKIDVFKYSFDKEKGYSLIKEGNIELLLIKMESLNKLKDVIGEFLNIEQFELSKKNVGEEKLYRFAYQEYKKEFYLPKEVLENIYKENEQMKYFYNEQERNDMYLKWLKSV